VSRSEGEASEGEKGERCSNSLKAPLSGACNGKKGKGGGKRKKRKAVVNLKFTWKRGSLWPSPPLVSAGGIYPFSIPLYKGGEGEAVI